jgi:hypothetical protein
MEMLQIRRFAIVSTAFWAVLIASCGLDDSARVECQCAAATSLDLFPQCRDVEPVDRGAADSPFATRLPDCPSGVRLSLLRPTRPEFVLSNIELTFEGFSPIQYQDQLSEDFLFVPDIGDIENFPEVFDVPDNYNVDADVDTLWNRQAEDRYITNLLDRTRFQEPRFLRWYLRLQDERIPADDGLSITFRFPYELEFIERPKEDDAEDATPQIFAVKGRLELVFVTSTEENPVWTIRRWQDFRDRASAKLSWTELRAIFSQ